MAASSIAATYKVMHVKRSESNVMKQIQIQQFSMVLRCLSTQTVDSIYGPKARGRGDAALLHSLDNACKARAVF